MAVLTTKSREQRYVNIMETTATDDNTGIPTYYAAFPVTSGREERDPRLPYIPSLPCAIMECRPSSMTNNKLYTTEVTIITLSLTFCLTAVAMMNMRGAYTYMALTAVALACQGTLVYCLCSWRLAVQRLLPLSTMVQRRIDVYQRAWESNTLKDKLIAEIREANLTPTRRAALLDIMGLVNQRDGWNDEDYRLAVYEVAISVNAAEADAILDGEVATARLLDVHHHKYTTVPVTVGVIWICDWLFALIAYGSTLDGTAAVMVGLSSVLSMAAVFGLFTWTAFRLPLSLAPEESDDETLDSSSVHSRGSERSLSMVQLGTTEEVVR